MRWIHHTAAPLTALLLLLLLEGSPSAGRITAEYEDQLISRMLKKRRMVRAPAPEGKRIGTIVVEREDIIAEADPYPNFINWVHVTTREYIVRRELLLAAGEPYSVARAAESARNLRKMFILAVARVIPCKGKDKDTIDVLVVTKDLWSIRLNMIYQQTGSMLQTLTLTPTEQNFLGRNIALALYLQVSHFDFANQRLYDRVGFGQQLVFDRLFGSRWRLRQQLILYVDGDVPCAGHLGPKSDADPLWCPNDASGLDGIYLRTILQRPLFSLAAKWSAQLDASLSIRQRRFPLQNGSLATASDASQPEASRAHVPRVYDGRVFSSSLMIARSFGERFKHDLAWGVLTYQADYASPDTFAFDSDVRRWFVDSVLPRSEINSAFVTRYVFRPTRYLRVRNVDTFALSEDLRVGPSASVELRFATDLQDQRRSFIEIFLEADYVSVYRDNIFSLSLQARTRRQFGLAGGPAWVNNVATVALREATPRLWIGRLFFQAALTLREDDLDRGSTTFDSSLVRGYAATGRVGRHAVRLTGEYRTRPINLFTLHLGLVTFYEGGAVWGAWGPGQEAVPFAYHHSVGIGLRALFPQFDRQTFRLDLAFPLTRARGSFGTWFSASFGQAFLLSAAYRPRLWIW